MVAAAALGSLVRRGAVLGGRHAGPARAQRVLGWRGVATAASPRAAPKSRIGAVCGLGLLGGAFWAVGQQERAVAESVAQEAADDVKPAFEAMVMRMQDEICDAIAEMDGSGPFREDKWERPNDCGGGRSRVLQDGNVFEKAGVNVSIVKGKLPPAAVKQMRSRGKPMGSDTSPPFYAAGISLVIHPKNPMAPTVHLNYRYFEVTDSESGEVTWWFGGGSDLTPSYLFEDDAIEFHSKLKQACDKHDPTYFDKFKKWCDTYFYNPHRDEARGVGGIFFDDLDERPANSDPTLDDRHAILKFSTDCLESFLPAYLPIMRRRKDMPFTEKQKEWQQMRRGRYVEFNLVYDRGTKFGLNTPKNARIESILVSLPLTARWEYMHEVAPGSDEAKIQEVLKSPRDWAVDLSNLKKASFSELMEQLAKRDPAAAAAAK